MIKCKNVAYTYKKLSFYFVVSKYYLPLQRWNKKEDINND